MRALWLATWHPSAEGVDSDGRPKEALGKRIVLSVVFLVIGHVLMLGDIFWLALVAYWSATLSILVVPRRLLGIPIVVGASIILAHVGGYKLYGAPTLRDSRPVLENALILDHFETPNFLVATDGSRHEMAGFQFRKNVLAMAPAEQQRLIDNSGEPLRFVVANTPSGYVGEWRHMYGCGNTWVPRFLPGTLPSHSEMDLAYLLHRVVEPPGSDWSHD